MSAFQPWTGSMFKHDMPSRFEAKKAARMATEAAWRAVCKVVDLRDKRTCRCCGKRTNPAATGLLERGHRHHLVYRSAGGEDVSSNLATLCAQCHADEHAHRLRVEGNADVALTFWRKDDAGAWFISRQEVGVHQVVRD